MGGEEMITSAWNTTGSGGGGLHVHHKVMAHMTFYWGHRTDILFTGWPGNSAAMYALALIFVFSLAVAVEWFSYCSIIKPGTNRVAAGFFRTGMHAVRTGFTYMVMLAVVSFDGGVFLTAVAGRAVGFCLFGSRAFKKSSGPEREPDLPLVKF